MPSLLAVLLASLAGWVIDDLVQPSVGAGPAFAVSAAGSLAVFFVARAWLVRLRGR